MSLLFREIEDLKPSEVFNTIPYHLQVIFCGQCLDSTIELLKQKCDEECIRIALEKVMQELKNPVK